jgi:hypothetical protein
VPVGRSPRHGKTHRKSQVVFLALKTAIHRIAGVNRPLNVVLQVHISPGHNIAGAIDREHLLPTNVPVEVLEQVKLVAGILRNEHRAEREANVHVIQEVVGMSDNA